MNQHKDYINEPAKTIPVLTDADVVVCGGGPSGFIAAISAARNGAKTILIEHYGFLGGMATAGMVGPISKFNFQDERIVLGIPDEFLKRMQQMNGAIIDLPSGNIPYDPEIYKYVSLKMVEEAGVTILLHTSVAGCMYDEHNEGKLTHVLIENKSGRQAIRSRYFIDCTGTGDLISRSRLPWEMRNIKNGELQPMSLFFRLGGVDTDVLNTLMSHDGVKYANVQLNKLLQEEMVAGRLANFGGPWAVHGSTIRRGEVSVNATRYKGNAADGIELSTAEKQLRQDVFKIVAVFKKNVPAFRNAYLIDTATQVGIRETRGIIGLYTMKAEDILTPGNFEDTVAYGAHPIDIHRSDTSKQDVSFLQKPYPIPYRALIPQESDNVLVAGSCLSATHEAFASVRVQAQCMALGQAAGLAAAMCAKQDLPVYKLSGNELRDELKRQGAFV
ncbi:FAD-dependent oxidoreductase [Pedobacter sp. BS3]|uniref:FAD-dependent oxidoreductase n=1 Tax=Pedobacter sp. BS3 TaxID=2567937 RepID=UPI001659501A|nr:FAD-dependent oxidoreductase [Pedobacter sp. BS3]